MSTLLERITNLFKPAELLTPGVYHYQSPPDHDIQYRLHLRVGNQGQGLLIINASTILHLNQTATEYAYHIIQGTTSENVAKDIANRYKIDRSEARRDFLEISKKIKTLLEEPDLDPVSFLDISRDDPYSEDLSAPFRLDCAITYQQGTKSSPDYAPQRRVDRELTTEEWLGIIDKAWHAGIPHLIFTGGEPTQREDLITLISRAEKNGQVTGLLSEGYRFSDPNFRKEILLSGLDHLLFLLSPLDSESWDALKAILDEDLFTTVHITITPEIISRLDQVIETSRSLGANAISLSIADPDNQELHRALAAAQSLVAEAGLPLKWDLPVPYSAHNPIAVEMEGVPENIPGAGNAWFYVEPDGDLLPGQGVNQVLGNLHSDPWTGIWEKSSQG
jgi:organic radical activating enzyme